MADSKDLLNNNILDKKCYDCLYQDIESLNDIYDTDDEKKYLMTKDASSSDNEGSSQL